MDHVVSVTLFKSKNLSKLDLLSSHRLFWMRCKGTRDGSGRWYTICTKYSATEDRGLPGYKRIRWNARTLSHRVYNLTCLV